MFTPFSAPVHFVCWLASPKDSFINLDQNRSEIIIFSSISGHFFSMNFTMAQGPLEAVLNISRKHLTLLGCSDQTIDLPKLIRYRWKDNILSFHCRYVLLKVQPHMKLICPCEKVALCYAPKMFIYVLSNDKGVLASPLSIYVFGNNWITNEEGRHN